MAKLPRLLLGLISQDRALANARAAATHLSRCRVEKAEIDLFLAELAVQKASRTA